MDVSENKTGIRWLFLGGLVRSGGEPHNDPRTLWWWSHDALMTTYDKTCHKWCQNHAQIIPENSSKFHIKFSIPFLHIFFCHSISTSPRHFFVFTFLRFYMWASPVQFFQPMRSPIDSPFYLQFSTIFPPFLDPLEPPLIGLDYRHTHFSRGRWNPFLYLNF